MASLAAYLRADHFEVEVYHAIYKLIAQIWAKGKVVPTQRELAARLTKALAKQSPVVLSTIQSFMAKIYGVDTTSVTYEELAEGITRTELASLAGDAATMDINEFMTELKERVDKYHPLLQGGTTKYVDPLDPKYIQEMIDMEEATEKTRVRLGLPRIDGMLRKGGMLPGELIEVLALTNGGKTGFMVGGLSHNFLQQGLRVAYFSLDVSKEEIIARLHARISGVSLDDRSATLREIMYKVDAWNEQWGVERNAFTCIEEPSLKYTVDGLRHKLQSIVQVKGPMDAVFIDYGDNCKSTARYDKKYDGAGEIFSQIQGWGKEDDFVPVTATQVHRKGYDEEIITLKNIADGFNKTWPAQLVLSINQTKDERMMNGITPMRIALLKNTKGRSGIVFPMQVDWERMHFMENTESEPFDIESLRKAKSDDEQYEKRGRKKEKEEPLIKSRARFVPKKTTDDVGPIEPEEALV